VPNIGSLSPGTTPPGTGENEVGTMHLETAMVMIVGGVALVALRLILAVVGKDFAADHPGCALQKRDLANPEAPQRAWRGTGRNSHLMYFPEAQPIWLTHNVTPAPVPVPLQRKAS
jgi:hypothetical protein